MEACCNINLRYPLDFVKDITVEEKRLILLSFKSFKKIYNLKFCGLTALGLEK